MNHKHHPICTIIHITLLATSKLHSQTQKDTELAIKTLKYSLVAAQLMASIATIFNKFLYLLILLVHLGCFICTTTTTTSSSSYTAGKRSPPSKKRKIIPLSQPSSPSLPKFKTHHALSSSWHCIKQLFSTKSCKNSTVTATAQSTAIAAAQSLISFTQPDPYRKPLVSLPESDISSGTNLFFPLRNNIFPCTACGEIFHSPHVLETHQTLKHGVSELPGSDPGHNIVQMIFKSGWPESKPFPTITRVLKINNRPKILGKFEEYRGAVKSKAASHGGDERCIADGNELMRFHCSTFLCNLGHNGDSCICSQQFCHICGIIKSGFSPKLDGVATLSTSWRAHVAIPDDVEREFRFMHVKRAMLVCRVIAGWVGSESDTNHVLKENGSFDSLMVSGETEEELLVFNPAAVLPCFVILYTA